MIHRKAWQKYSYSTAIHRFFHISKMKFHFCSNICSVNPAVASGFFALRTPLLPFDGLLSWSDGLEAPAAGDDRARLEQALAADRARLRERLHHIVSRPEVREAIFVGSPSLDERLAVWRRDPDSKQGQKVERAIIRYFVRMAARPTPFGPEGSGRCREPPRRGGRRL